MSRMVITLGHHAFRKPYRIGNRVRNDRDGTHADKVRLLDDSETKYAFEGLFIRRNVWTRQRIQAKWMGDIWLQRKKNPPVVDFRRGAITNKGQPGNGWVAAHLVA